MASASYHSESIPLLLWQRLTQSRFIPMSSQTETSSLLAPNVSVTMRSQWNRQHFFPLPNESDANIRENRYANVVLSGRTTMFQWIFEHMERNRRRWLTMKIENELPDGNIIVSPKVSVVWSLRQPSSLASGFHDTSFESSVLLERRNCAGSVRCGIDMVPVCLHACRCREASESWPTAPSLS